MQEISFRSILKVLVVIALGWILFIVRDAIVIILTALIIASAIDPSVDWLQKFRIPRSVAVLILFLAGAALFTLIAVLFVPIVGDQLSGIAQSYPSYVERLNSELAFVSSLASQYGISFDIQSALGSVTSSFGSAAGGVFSWVGNIVGGVFTLIIFFSLVFYMSVYEADLKRFIRRLLPIKYQPYSSQITNRIQFKLGHWLRGQLLLGVIIGFMSWVGLVAAGVNYAVALAIVAGVFELIPYVGPLLAAVPALFIALTQSPWHAVYVIVLYTAIQTLENQLIVPKVMEKTVGLHPVLVITALVLGQQMGGLLGVILAVPVATIASIIAEDLLPRAEEDTSLLENDVHSTPSKS